jgi:hypothetical protein
MSDIRFVERLGDAIEAATTERMKSRRRRLRNVLGGMLAVAVVGTSVATATSLFDDSEQLAAQIVYCYSTPSLDGGANGITPSATPPTEACAAELGTPGPRVACDAGDSVSVFPGRSTEICARHGFKPLPAEYVSARRRVGALARKVLALEESAGCIPPKQFAARVQALLDRAGWAGWRPQLRLDVSDGPCGVVSALNGDGSRSVEPALDFENRRVMVFGEGS